MSRCIASLLACSLIIGCSDETRVNPAPVPLKPAEDASAPGTDAGDAATDAPATHEAGPRKREVMRRSPFGNLQATGNLLFDGDFEWSGGGSGAWVGLSVDGQVDLPLETGGLCRSGLRCVAMDKSFDMLGYATRASHSAVDVSFWARVPDADCSVVSGYVASLMTDFILLTIRPDTDAPGADGWCRFHAVVPRQPQEGIGVYLSPEKLDAGKRVLIDDVVAVAADGLSPLSLEAEHVPDSTRKRVESRLDILRRNRWLGVRPESIPVP